ncbi:MAG TPA: FkbM family methyltransferase [Alphaproteobacteria bacterium]|nr:FkbM family methyltransferase [Alphaproteobacteria bacterium]
MSAWARRGGEALIGRIFDKYDRYRLLQWLARDQGISAFVVDGEQGVVEGPVEDFAIMRTYAQKRSWAKATAERIAAFLVDGGTYLDIGANIGLTTIPVARNAKIECVAFEPDPAMFALLTANVARNCGDADVALRNLALSDRDATVTLSRSPGNAGDIRIQRHTGPAANGAASWPSVEVPARRPDGLGLRTRDALAVKIDTQGAEALVVAGGRGVLARAGLLTLEFRPYALAANAGDVGVILDFLRENFRHGEIVRGDSAEAAESQPIAALISRLATLADADRGDPDVYYDVWLFK